MNSIKYKQVYLFVHTQSLCQSRIARVPWTPTITHTFGRSRGEGGLRALHALLFIGQVCQKTQKTPSSAHKPRCPAGFSAVTSAWVLLRGSNTAGGGHGLRMILVCTKWCYRLIRLYPQKPSFRTNHIGTMEPLVFSGNYLCLVISGVWLWSVCSLKRIKILTCIYNVWYL